MRTYYTHPPEEHFLHAFSSYSEPEKSIFWLDSLYLCLTSITENANTAFCCNISPWCSQKKEKRLPWESREWWHKPFPKGFPVLIIPKGYLVQGELLEPYVSNPLVLCFHFFFFLNVLIKGIYIFKVFVTYIHQLSNIYYMCSWQAKMLGTSTDHRERRSNRMGFYD